MTDIIYDGRPVKTLRVTSLGELFISLAFVFEDGTKEVRGYFREES